ncbi:MAG: ABC transporter substrate-binding protein [Ilumatobacteraceae bacterium]|nr:ABC transporter substrate-binding protein [Ilumatobacteraceae bacterium]
MRHRTKRARTASTVSAFVIAFSLLATACGGSDSGLSDSGGSDTTSAPTEDIAPVPGGSLIIAGEAEVSNPWTPGAIQCDSYCQMRARAFYDPIAVVGEDKEVHPWLAESITANADSSVFTIKVRAGISFTDGTPVDADAIIYNLNATSSGLLIKPATKDLARNEDGTLVIEKIDDMSFTLATGKDGDAGSPLPWPTFPYLLTTQLGLVASPKWLDAVKAGTAKPDQPIGSGPFTFVSYAPGDKMVVKKNPNYWMKDKDGVQLPYLDQIEFRVITDSKVRQSALESGEVDLIATSDTNAIKPLSENSSFVWTRQEEFGEVAYLLINLSKKGPLQDRNVRCALGMAVDKVALIAATGSGFNEPAGGMMSPGQEGYLEDNGGPTYDVEAGKKLIADYEATNGDVKVIYSTTTSASNLLLAQFLQTAWTAIGVDTEVVQIEQSKLISNAIMGSEEFEAFGWRNHAGIFVDQQNFWWNGNGANPPGQLALNFGRLNDPVINDLLAKARSEADPEVRRGYAEDINRQFGKECWTLPNSYTKWAVFSKPEVKGIGNTPTPDGTSTARDGAGFPGQVYTHALFKTAG